MRTLFFIICLSGVTALACAEDAGLLLVNGESASFYYTIDPPSTGRHAGTADVFSSLDRFNFSLLAPGGSLRLQGLAAGAHTVVGFWAAESVADYGVFSLEVVLAAGQTKNFTLKKSAAAASREYRPAAVKDTLPATPIVIDNDYTDWDGYPAVAVFPPSAQPQQFTCQSKEGARNLPIRNSNFWGRAGTQLMSVKSLVSGDILSFHFSAASVFQPGLSVFLYLFDDRKTTELNLYTIEIPVAADGGEGKVLLWQRDVTEPTEIGAFRSAGFLLEAALDLTRLPAALREGLISRYSFDLKTSFYESERGVHEEFFFTSIYFRDLYMRK